MPQLNFLAIPQPGGAEPFYVALDQIIFFRALTPQESVGLGDRTWVALSDGRDIRSSAGPEELTAAYDAAKAAQGSGS